METDRRLGSGVFFSSAPEFARESKEQEQPFFVLYLCTYLPHTPHTMPDVSMGGRLQ
jgi:hypothetical protein